jgi:AmpE protein
MTILIVLVGLLISHFATGFRHLRNFGWLMWPVEWGHRRLPDQAWLPFVLVAAVGFMVAWLATLLMTGLFGLVGWIVLALVVFIYSLGPRDLDQDVRTLLGRNSNRPDLTVDSAAAAMQLSLEDPPAQSAAAVFHAGLSRWFGILFWFVVLGIPGALIYRLTRVALQSDRFSESEILWLARLRIVLDWPVLALMVLAAGLCGDLDRIYQAWKEQRESGTGWLLTPALLDRVAEAIVPADADFNGGLVAGHQMVWRMLVLWMVVLSVMLLAGWLA